MKQLILCVLLFGNISFASAQSYLRGNSPFRYFVGKSEPDAVWKNIDFDDATWKSDTMPLGYGYGKKDVSIRIIDTCTSLYLRYHFATEPNMSKTASFVPLFDDGFIAYLNGVEILRFNMGKKGEAAPFNKLSERSHEATNYWSDIEAYYLDSTLFKANLKEGDNVLSIQVHNDSIKGSDFVFLCASLFGMDFGIGDLYTVENHAHRHIDLDSSEFPIVSITTDEYGIPRGAKNVKAEMQIIDKAMINKPSMIPSLKTAINIEVHGQSSADFAKKSYEIELKAPNGSDTSFALLGMPTDEDWILYAPYNDKSLVRNDVVFEMGRKLGYYEPRTRKCELILNGEYRGLYFLTERIKRAKDRVNISKLDTTENSGMSITGGYIVKYDKGGSGLQYVSPKADKITFDQKNYINAVFKDLENVKKSPLVADTALGYQRYINTQSLIDYIVISELIKGSDAYNVSTYMYKDRNDKDGRICFGPLWDSDLTFGASYFQNGSSTNGWQFQENTYLGIGRYMADTNFKKAFIARWNSLRANTFSKDAIYKLIDEKLSDLKTAKKRNFDVWPIFDITYFGTYDRFTHEQTIDAMKSWTDTRLAWVDNNITKIKYNLPVDVETIKSSPRPFTIFPQNINSDFTISGNFEQNGNYRVAIISSMGQVLQVVFDGNIDKTYQTIDCKIQQNVAPGVYFICISLNSMPLQSIPCVIKQN